MSESKEKSLEQLRKIFSEMDARTVQVEQDVKEMQAFIERFAAIEENRKQLEAYYFGDWMKDVAAYEALGLEESFYSICEDPIWNTTGCLQSERIRLLKLLADSL